MTQNRSLSLATVAMVLLSGVGATATAAQGKPTRVPMAWTSATPMPLSDAAIAYAHAQCDNQPNSFYVIEGNNQTIARTTKAWRYDADTDTWNVLAPIPNPPGNVGTAAVCHQGFIYVAGGAHVGFNRLFIYDVANDTWTAGANIPRNVLGAAMGAFGGKAYLIGGDDDLTLGSGTSNEVDIYDIASDTWTTTGAPMPTAVIEGGWRQVGQYVYVVGGWTDTFPVNSNVTQRYDMSANTWAIGPTFTSQRADFALAVTSQFLYAIGGDTNGGGSADATALVERLDHTAFPAGAWTDTADPLPGPLARVRAGFCTSAVSGGESWALDGFFGLAVQRINQYRPSEPCPPGGPPAPVVVKAGATLAVEGCGPANGAIDPGETVTVDFTLRNIGTADTTSVVATLQAAGGVTPITTSQTYGVLASGGPAVSRPFTFSAAGACGGTLTASLAVQDGAMNLGTKTYTFTMGTSSTTDMATFSNPGPITINSVGPATPYPSDIAVSGLTDSISKVTVTVTGLTHTSPTDIDILLVGPNGQGMILLSDVVGGAITNVTITLDDDATQAITPPLVNGTYWPFNIDFVQDPFPAPAPPPPASYYGTELAFFNGIDPNGTWSLFVVDDQGGGAGSISGGWSITITTAVPVCCQGGVPQVSINDVSVTEGNAGTTTATFTAALSTVSTQTVTVDFATADGTATTASNDYMATSGTLTFAPGVPAQPIQVTVIGDTAFEPNETFFVNLSNPVNATIGDGQGVGTILNDDGPLGTNFVSELSHGYMEQDNLASAGGVPDLDYYRIAQKPRSSYEVVVDATSGDIGPGLEVALVAPDGTTIIQNSDGMSILNFSRTLRWVNTTAGEVTNEFVRVRSVGCTTNCGPDDVYVIRAYETTYSIPRFNNSGTQITVLLLQNPTSNYVINPTIYFWDSTGALIGTSSASLLPKELLVLNTATVAPGVGGSVTVVHDGQYGALSGKTVALEPATGFSFDSPMLPRVKVN